MASLKRSSLAEELSNHPAKKLRRDNIESQYFQNKNDQAQFLEIFQSIQQSLAHISQDISKEIAEYATGDIKHCYNDKCKQEISTLCIDKDIYDNNPENVNKLGYKYCNKSSEKYFCNKCMDNVQNDNCCGSLLYVPSSDKCRDCKIPINSECDCDKFECRICNVKYCEECQDMKECTACGEEYFCEGCCHSASNDEFMQIAHICKGCYDDKIIECSKCKAPCELLYEWNNYVWNSDKYRDNGEHYEMWVCESKDCKNFVCTNCIEKDHTVPEQDGDSVKCNKEECKTRVKVCKDHIKNQVCCYSHKAKDKK